MYNLRRYQSDLIFRDPHSHPRSRIPQSQATGKALTGSELSTHSFESTDHLDVPNSANSTYSFDVDVDTSIPATSRPASPTSTVSSLTLSISSVPSRVFIDRAQKPKGARKPRKRRVPPTQRPPRSPSLISTYTVYETDPLRPLASTVQDRRMKVDQRHFRAQPTRTAPPVSRSALMSSSNTSVSTVRTHVSRTVERPRQLRHPYSSSYAPSPRTSAFEFPSSETPRGHPSSGYTWLSELNYYDSDVSMGQFASKIKTNSNFKSSSNYEAPSISGVSVVSTSRTQTTSRSHQSQSHVRPLPPTPGSKPMPIQKKKRHVPPPLRLSESACRMESLTPVIDNEVTLPSSALLTPNISTAALTPISPAFKKPSEHEQRRRKLMKVGKIFGENVPLDLVLPPRQSSDDIPPVPPLPPIATDASSKARDSGDDDGNRRSSLTLPGLGLSSLTSVIRTKKPELVVRPKVVRKKRSSKSYKEGARRRASNHDLKSSRSQALSNPTQPTFQLVVQDEDSKFSDVDHPAIRPLPYRTRIEPGYFPELVRTDAPFVFGRLPGSPGLQGDGRYGVFRRERRQGWSGEWNQDDLQDVITKLRQLK